MCMGGTTRLFKIDRKDPIVAVREWNIHDINGRYVLKPITMSTGSQGTAWYPEKGPIFKSDLAPDVLKHKTIVKDLGFWVLVGGINDPKNKPTLKWRQRLVKSSKPLNEKAAEAGFYTHAGPREYGLQTYSHRCWGIVNIFGNVVRHNHYEKTPFGYRAEYAEIAALVVSTDSLVEKLTKSYDKIIPIITNGLDPVVNHSRW